MKVVQKMGKIKYKVTNILKEFSKLLDSKINMEDFIYEIEKTPAIWDSSSDDYSNETVKLNTWKSVMVAFLPDFEEKPMTDKNMLVSKQVCFL